MHILLTCQDAAQFFKGLTGTEIREAGGELTLTPQISPSCQRCRMNQDKNTDPQAAPGEPPRAASFLPHLGNPPLSFIMPCKYMGWVTTGTGPMHRYLLGCGHTYTSCRKRSQGSACFCPECADAWAEQTTEPETNADRLELTDAGYIALEERDPRCGRYTDPIFVTEDTCQIPPHGFPQIP